MTTPTETTNVIPHRSHLIGCNRNPAVTPGGFSVSAMARQQGRMKRGSDGCMDVAKAATKWLDARAAR